LENDLSRLSHEDPFLTILEVGATHGIPAIRYARAFPQAQIFPLSLYVRTSRFSSTCSLFSRIVLLQKGLSDKPGTERIGLTHHPYDHSLLLSSLADQTEQVALTTLDIFEIEHNIERIHLLKIDVEGLEMEVLNGALTALKSSIVSLI
jgi:FkbM family methyltransferase